MLKSVLPRSSGLQAQSVELYLSPIDTYPAGIAAQASNYET